ncbi:MAG: hypothetical protein IJS28_03125 [Synergistaceae bacterium]|nr:hypothetical protein [Synergistaceae bacterium]
MTWHVKAMAVSVILFVCLVIIVSVEWGEVWYDFVIYSGRLENYTTTFPFLTEKGSWFTGLGFGFLEQLNRFRTVSFLDSFYLMTLLESGTVGFILLIGTIIRFSFMYFRDTRYMNRFHRVAGGLLAVMLWHGLFEFVTYGNDYTDVIHWLLLIIAVNERCANSLNLSRSRMPLKTHEA